MKNKELFNKLLEEAYQELQKVKEIRFDAGDQYSIFVVNDGVKGLYIKTIVFDNWNNDEKVVWGLLLKHNFERFLEKTTLFNRRKKNVHSGDLANFQRFDDEQNKMYKHLGKVYTGTMTDNTIKEWKKEIKKSLKFFWKEFGLTKDII